MMIFTGKAIEWDGENAKELANFLEGQVGQKVLQHLLLMTPPNYDGPNANQMIAAGKMMEGYQQALETLVGLTKEQPAQPQKPEPQYPDIDDDSKWDAPKTK